ncbi:MAG: prepilin-type N-terminal cleavage/methylation domain-containing protein [Planctomycetota bacterium]
MTPGTQPSRPSRRGYTLVELVIVVLLIAVLASIAVPSTVDLVSQANERTVVTQVREIFNAAELYRARHGEWPRNAPQWSFPEDFAGMLPRDVFTDPSPIGDAYDWNGPGTGAPTIGVSIESVSLATASSIDELFDDGELSSGWVTRSSGYLNFELAPR